MNNEEIKARLKGQIDRVNRPVVWAVLNSEGVVMECGFKTKEEAEKWKLEIFFGYYKECEIKLIKRPHLYKPS